MSLPAPQSNEIVDPETKAWSVVEQPVRKVIDIPQRVYGGRFGSTAVKFEFSRTYMASGRLPELLRLVL